MNFIYETPWWLPSGFLFAGLALFIAGNNRLQRKLIYSGVIVAAIGLLIALTSYLLDSPREIVIKRTRALAAAAENRQWHSFEELLDPQIALVAWTGRSEITAGAKHYAELYDLSDLSILRLNAEATEPTFTVTMQVSATFRDAPAIITNWKLEWEKAEAGWLLSEIEPLGGPLFPASVVEHYFTRKPR